MGVVALHTIKVTRILSLSRNFRFIVRIVIARIKAQYELNSNNVVTMAASSQPGDLVMRYRTHNRKPTVT